MQSIIYQVLSWSTDKCIGIGMIIVLIISSFLGTSETLQTNIISGLVGYMGKTMKDSLQKGDN